MSPANLPLAHPLCKVEFDVSNPESGLYVEARFMKKCCPGCCFSPPICNGNVLILLPNTRQSQVLFEPSLFPAQFCRRGNERNSPVATRMEPVVLDYFCSGLMSGGLGNGPCLLSAEAVISCCSPEARL